MFYLFLFLIGLSFPVFYIIGFIQFFKWIFQLGSRKNVEPSEILTKDQTKAPVLLYQEKAVEEEIAIPKPPAVIPPSPQPAFSEQMSHFWSNWYSDNSINLLLYIGAFLIIASASIYVGFQWENIAGTAKAFLFSLLTVVFFGCGIWFYQIPKIKHAGATFLAIAALLIPFNGIAWHNFVLKGAGFPPGTLWLVTSLAAITAYAFLAYYIKHPFYSYIAGFGGLSFMLSFINVSAFERQYYILAGIATAFVLLCMARLVKRDDKEKQRTYTAPLSLTAHVIMPLSLFWGLVLALPSGLIFSLESTLSVLLASLYYVLAYEFEKKESYLRFGLLLLPVSLFLGGKWQNFDTTNILTVLQGVSIGYIGIAYYLKRKKYAQNSVFIQASQIITPVVLGLSFFESKVYSFSFSLMLLGSSLYYLSYYSVANSKIGLGTGLLLIAATIFTFGKSYAIPTRQLFIFLQILGFGYFAGSYYTKKLWKEESAIFLSVAQVIVFGMFFVGVLPSLVTASYSWEIVSVSFLTTLFCFINRFYTRGELFAVFTEILLSISVFLLAKWLEFPALTMYYLFEALVILYLTIPYAIKRVDFPIYQSVTVVALLHGAGIYLLSLSEGFEPIHILLFAAVPAVYGIWAVFLYKKDEYLYYSFVFLAIVFYRIAYDYIPFDDKYYYLGTAYIVSMLASYALSVYFQNTKSRSTAFLVNAIGNGLLGGILTISDASFFMIASACYAGVILDIAIRKEKLALIYLSNLFVYITLFTLFKSSRIQTQLYPVLFCLFSYGIYGVSSLLSDTLKTYYRRSGLAGAALSSILFSYFAPLFYLPEYFQSTNTQDLTKELERNALVSAYLVTMLYSYHAYSTKSEKFGYVASSVFMYTYEWQMRYLEFSQTQVYMLPLGVYFLVISFIQRIKNRLEYHVLFDYIGFGFLFVPLLFQVFGGDPSERPFHALLMGGEGIVLLLIGNSIHHKRYVYTGIAAMVIAIISQTYEYLFNMERWIITAIAGLLFLGTAIFLMIKRKES